MIKTLRFDGAPYCIWIATMTAILMCWDISLNATPSFAAAFKDEEAEVVKVVLRKQWTISSDNNDIVFGMIAGADVGHDKSVYLLDGQLKRIMVIGDSGELINVFGQEGPGPGELTNPNEIILSEDGHVFVAEHWPSRIQEITLAGEPVASLNPSFNQSDFSVYAIHKTGLASGLLVSMMSQRTYDSGKEYVTTRLVSLGPAGEISREYLKWEYEFKFRRDFVDETVGFFPAQGWCLLQDGTLAVAPYRDRYLIDFLGKKGEQMYSIESDYRSPERTVDEIKAIKSMKKKTVNGVDVPLRFELEKTDPAIYSIQALNDDTIWVASSMHIRELPEDAALRYDVYTSEGDYVGEHILFFKHDNKRDRIWLLRDGSILQVKNYYNENMSVVVPDTIDKTSIEDIGWSIILWNIESDMRSH